MKALNIFLATVVLALGLILVITVTHPTHSTRASDDPPLIGEMYPSGPPIDTNKRLSGPPDTAVEAAIYALKKAYDEHPHYYEYGGVVMQMPSGRFNSSTPRTEGNASGMNIVYDFMAYDGQYPIVADYHTHPCMDGYNPSLFSDTDLKSAREYRLPGYMLDECTGDVHLWAPGDPYYVPPELRGDVMPNQYNAFGRIVGHIPVDGLHVPKP